MAQPQIGAVRPCWRTVIGLLILAHACSAFREVNRSCAQGCEAVGNCNRELGVCECPFGRTGPACETHLLGSCRTSADPKALPFYGPSHPKSCACLRQLWVIAWNKERNAAYLPSVQNWGGGRGLKVCYERKGIPEDKQFSDPPKIDTPDVTWRLPLSLGGREEERFKTIDDIKTHTVRPMIDGGPMDACPMRCNERGSCSDMGHCRCMPGFKGGSCEEQDKTFHGCLNKCGGKGKCMHGFCHCEQGYWGMDCTRSRAYEPDPAVPLEVNLTAYSRTKLKIYRYELPWNISYYLAVDDWHFGYNPLYSAFEAFFDQFASDTVVRTENPHEANLFYIPLLDFLKDDNAGDVFEYTRRAVHFVKNAYPQFWGRNQGKDHFLWLPGDLGACWLLDEPEVQNPIKVVHWGLQVNATSYTKMPHYHWVVNKPVNKEYHCFKVEKDVVTPCWVGHRDAGFEEIAHSAAVYNETVGNGTGVVKRRYLLFFGGSIRHQQFEYSGGVRQAFDKHVASKKDPDVIIGGGVYRYREATFCLAPYGDGWGSRIGHILLGGCIPVIIQEQVHQPFDDVLQYKDFALRLRVDDIPNLLTILRSVPEAQIQRYRERMAEVYRAFHWKSDLGGLAYNYTLRSLRKKLFNLWGVHYLRRQ